MKRKVFKNIVIALLVVFVLIQFIRPARNNGVAASAADITRAVTVPDTIMGILKRSCYDCHSNYTNYPWYANVSPMSLLLANHIKNGKKELNFSEFAQYSRRKMKSKLTSIASQVDKGEMPLKSYLLIHRNASLNKGQVQLIKNWVDSAKAELDLKSQ